MSDIDELRPWEQRDDEPDKYYRAFLAWRDCTAGESGRDRTMLEAYRMYTGDRGIQRTPSFFFDWRNDYDWVDRARAWDRYVRLRTDEAMISGREQIAKERGVSLADVEADHMEVIDRGIAKLAEFLESTNPQMWSPTDANQMLRAATEGLGMHLKFRSLKDDKAPDTPPLTNDELEDIFGFGDMPEADS